MCGVCVCVSMSALGGSGFHHPLPPPSLNHVIHHVNALITHHYPEVQFPRHPADAHLFTASGKEINREGLNLKSNEMAGLVRGGWGPLLEAAKVTSAATVD